MANFHDGNKVISDLWRPDGTISLFEVEPASALASLSMYVTLPYDGLSAAQALIQPLGLPDPDSRIGDVNAYNDREMSPYTGSGL